MENLSYSSYPDSSNSSPRSREIDDGQSFEEPLSNYKVKFMCSYGGKIQPRPHDNQLAYIGGDTKILAVDRNIKLSLMMSKLTALSNYPDICFKYQLPGEDLDALISVTNDEDLEHMMMEYDRLYRNSAKPARLRLFLFRLNPLGFGSDEVQSERQWFVDALNSVQAIDVASPPAAAVPAVNPDYLFGLDKGLPPVPVTKFVDVAPAVLSAPEVSVFAGSERIQEKIPPPATVPVQMPIPVGLLPDRHVASGAYEQQPVYFIPTAASAYQVPRPVTGQIGQGYYGVQRVVQEVYREQPMYNAVQPSTVASVQQQPIGMIQAAKVGGAVAEQQGYVVGYDSAGRQVYFTPPYATAVSAVDSRQGGGGGGALNQDAKGGQT